MINIEIEFSTDNASFIDDYEYQWNLILDYVVKRIKEGYKEGKIRDINGNTVGDYIVKNTK